ncbi:DUF1538 domain-containing protein [Oceanispirochaeta crateris]|uniref:DUF1538 domain-containing protein n=1 Tax=Oceanispirochaeta crateris TaxID=2518645 RepID=A0A5C1QJ17_9SPIO|nr:DUF1538 domain-containing protein [Oceanispirochaeta crateris]QEN06476.1 DUF1538 domain-containing protein [Oceanispirochaeta crateris]
MVKGYKKEKAASRPVIKMPPRAAFSMISNYIGRKISEQARALAFIVAYLLVFQLLVVRSPEAFSLQNLLGIIMVVLGLAFFMEGLALGLMPLGEYVGLKLPVKVRLYQIIFFGLIVGFISTLAEPAISTLRSAGRGVTPWENPLLYSLLGIYQEGFIASVGGGVALAVALSLYRYHKGISLKPFILISVPILLALTLLFSLNPQLRAVIGLAWDTGAVTTGPVTVPLVLALGIGVSRASGDRQGSTGGFGSIAMASLLPILGVMIFSLALFFTLPSEMEEAEFFSIENRTDAVKMLEGEKALESFAFEKGTQEARAAFYGNEEEYIAALKELSDGDKNQILSEMSPDIWWALRASESEKKVLGISTENIVPDAVQIPTTISEVIKNETTMAIRAIIPLIGILLAVVLLILREYPRHIDEFILGIVITILGMILLTTGLRYGLVPLGDTVGQQLPRVYEAQENEKIIEIPNFDLSLIQKAVDTDGNKSEIFAFMNASGEIQHVPFISRQYNKQSGVYTHVRRTPILFTGRMTKMGMIFVLLFAFGLGYGSTLAEPALNALGKNVEEITVGTVSKTGVIRAVSIGVGLGLMIGVLRIIYNIPMAWLLIPAYLLLILLTIFSSKEFTGIAWDSGGVTTGPITVPLVLSLGLGIGGAMGKADGFGILALASVFPILSVQIYGFMLSLKRNKSMAAVEQESTNESK